MSETTEAVKAAVEAWMTANQDKVMETLHRAALEGIELVAAGVMTKVGSFLDTNRQDLIAGIAAAVALSYQNRHPQGPPT